MFMLRLVQPTNETNFPYKGSHPQKPSMDGCPPRLEPSGEAAGSCRDGRWVNSSSVFSFCVQKSQGDPDKVPNTYKA